MHTGRVSGIIAAAAGTLIALRLIFPVMHISINILGNTVEVCRSHFYPLINSCLGAIDRIQGAEALKMLARAAYRPDFDRTLFEAFGIVILCLIALFTVNVLARKEE